MKAHSKYSFTLVEWAYAICWALIGAITVVAIFIMVAGIASLTRDSL